MAERVCCSYQNVLSIQNRVCCLYRVSTTKQVDHDDQNQADIPVQRKACREFAERMGWTIVYEEQENGVSGFKVSANDRDKFNSSRNMPNRANSIFCWCSCSTVLADEPKKRLSWSNGSSTTAFRSGASTKVNSESTRMSTVSPTTSASGRQTVRVRKPPCVPRPPSGRWCRKAASWWFRPLRL